MRLVHLFSEPDVYRELVSYRSVSHLKKFGIEYVEHINVPYKDVPPRGNCARPNVIVDENPVSYGHAYLGPGHYGCFSAHKNAVLKEFTDDIDYLMICECDCVLDVSPETFMEVLKEVCKTVDDHEIDYLSLGGNPLNQEVQHITERVGRVNAIFGTHCILFPQRIRNHLTHCFQNVFWDAVDVWYNRVIAKKAIANFPLASQVCGESLINKAFKGENRSRKNPKTFTKLL